MSNLQAQLIAVHAQQVTIFESKIESLEQEFQGHDFPIDHLASLQEMVEKFKEQTKAAEKIFALMLKMNRPAGNNCDAFLKSEDSYCMYTFLTARRKAAELIGDVDEFHKALALSIEVKDDSEKQKSKDNPKPNQDLFDLSWRIASSQSQIHSAARLAEALTNLQIAIMRSFGLNFWQGQRRLLRWDGDPKLKSNKS